MGSHRSALKHSEAAEDESVCARHLPTPPPQLLSCLCLPVGVNMFYICIIVYLYGDLAIYAAAVPISLMEVAW